MSVWGNIGTTLGKLGGGLADSARKVGDLTKEGLKKTGDTLKTGKEKLEDVLTSETNPQNPTEPQEPETEEQLRKRKFMKSLLSAGGSYSQQTPQYDFTPSMLDYSQYMGLSPETQRYLYGGM